MRDHAGLMLFLSSVLTLLLVARWVARQQRDCSRMAREVADQSRLLRLSAAAFRTPSLALLGHADQLKQPAIRALALQLVYLADDLQDRAHGTSVRTLDEEMLELPATIDAAIAVVEAMLGPGQRHWRVAPEIAGISLWADRRAMHEIFVRLLTNAASCSVDGDWIEIFPQNRPDGFAIVIEDEGSGIARPQAATGKLGGRQGADSRGIGLGLALARSLAEAHGGRLTVEAMMRVGTRVSLTMPTGKVRGFAAPFPPSEPHEGPLTPA